MMFSFRSLAADFPISDALMTTVIGLIVVFAVLAILILCIEALHALLSDKKQTEAPVSPVQNVRNEERISAGVLAEAPDNGFADDEEFIAAVSAAVSAYTGKANGSFVIKSIKKI